MTRQPDSTILDIERALLATLMLRPGDCYRVNVAAECFVSEQHGDLYATIQSLSSDAKPIDPVSLADHFEQQDRKPMANLAMTIGNEGLITPVPDAFAHRIRGMRKLVARADVTCGIDARIGRLKPVVHFHPGFVVLDPDGLQPQAMDIRRAADAHQNLIDRHVILLPV